MSLELSDFPSPVQGAGAGSCLCFTLTTTDLKIKRRNPIKQLEKLLLAAATPGREGKSWVWRELSADSH